MLTTAVVLLVMAGALHGPLLRERLRSVPDADGLTGASPVVVFTTVVLGGFRGVIADALWLRTSYLQQEGRFLELVQLADWITKLEPRTTDIWAFHAWNLAYNVSVMIPVAEDRWRWVQQGIHLLQDDGIRYNPSDPRIYQELGWLFQHKLGGDSDRLHAYYKAQWAEYVATRVGQNGRADYEAMAAEPDYREWIRRDLGLEMERMRVVDALYGPLDWRVPQSHAVYWSYRGLQVAGPEGYLPCSRMIYQSMAELFMRGRLTRADDGSVTMESDHRLLPRVFKAYEDALVRYDDAGMRDAYANFLAAATLMLDRQGKQRLARRAFEKLHTWFPSQLTSNGYKAFIALRRWEQGS